MRVNLPYLLLAVVLLWFPRQWMRLGIALWNRRRRRTEGMIRREEEPWHTSEPGDPAVDVRDEFGKIRNYVDLLRGAAGSLAIMGGWRIDPCITLSTEPTAFLLGEYLTVQIGILLLGLLAQTVRHEQNRLLFFAPIFFLAGLSIGLCGVTVAGFSFVMIWAFNPMLKNPAIFLSIYALLIGLFARLFLGSVNSLSLVAAFFFFLPVLLSAMAQRPLVLFARKSVRSHRT